MLTHICFSPYFLWSKYLQQKKQSRVPVLENSESLELWQSWSLVV